MVDTQEVERSNYYNHKIFLELIPQTLENLIEFIHARDIILSKEQIDILTSIERCYSDIRSTVDNNKFVTADVFPSNRLTREIMSDGEKIDRLCNLVRHYYIDNKNSVSYVIDPASATISYLESIVTIVIKSFS